MTTNDLATRLRKLREAFDAEVIEADAYTAGLVKLRREYTAQAVDALLQAEAPPAPPSARAATVTGQVGTLIQGDVQGHVFINGQRGKAPAQLLAAYLRELASHCGALPLQGVRDQHAASDILAISLDQVYTQLATTLTIDREPWQAAELSEDALREYLGQHTGAEILPAAQRTTVRLSESPVTHRGGGFGPESLGGATKGPNLEQTSAADLLRLFASWGPAPVVFQGPQLLTEAVASAPRLVLLGEPGSGKSTALRYLALTLARAALDERLALTADLEGWATLGDHGRLLPLLPFARQLASGPARPAGADDLWNYLHDRLERGGRYEGLAEAVHTELEAGNALLMLDGLDEVAGETSRRQVVAAVQAFASAYTRCRIIVSCRVRAYLGAHNQVWQLPGWPTATLADWTAAQMRHFASAWYAAVPNLTATRRSERATSLRRAIDTRADLRRLGVRPLLLTIMALVHLNDQSQLPKGSVALYSRCVDLLLGQWELARADGSDYGALLNHIELPDTDVKALRPLLEDVAYQAHSAMSDDSQGSIGSKDLLLQVMQFLQAKQHRNPFVGAQKFLEYTDVRAGLLQASDAGESYVFPHQTFQEYLAGRALVRDVEYLARISAVRNDDRWRIPILLGVSHLASEGALAMVSGLLADLVDAEGREPAQVGHDLLLAAEIGADLDWASLTGGTFNRLKRDLAAGLAQQIAGSALPTRERIRAGAYLAELGDPRHGVCTLRPAMVPIAGGTFVIGSSAEEAERAGSAYEAYYLQRGDKATAQQARTWPQNEINAVPLTLPSFELARYPVTNAQFKRFVEASGYVPEMSWWDADGRAWLTQQEPEPPSDGWQRRPQKDAPWFWDDEDVGSVRANYPVVGVSWYEATSFCRWLTATLNDDYVYRLPSEAEWEYAARGGAARHTYPWGEAEPTAEHANHYDMRALRPGYTTPVGAFPAGATPASELLDMAGNVLEWTQSEYRAYPYDPSNGRETPTNSARKRFTLRGGSWANGSITLRAANRSLYYPDARRSTLGLRLARQRA